MEGLHQTELQNSLEKKNARRWRKNTEVKISRMPKAPEAVLHPSEHDKLWQQVIGEAPTIANQHVSLLHETEPNEVRRHNPTEAHNIHGGLQLEKIGQVLISAAEARSRQAEPGAAVEKSSDSLERYIATVNRQELLDISSRIVVDGTSLRQAFETHLIGENALRRLIIEQVRGGNLHEALKREMIQHEVDFERDPQLRDHAQTQDPVASDNQAPTIALPLDNGQESGSRVVKPKAKKSSDKKEEVAEKAARNHVMDIALISIIMVLLVLVVILLVVRH